MKNLVSGRVGKSLYRMQCRHLVSRKKSIPGSRVGLSGSYELRRGFYDKAGKAIARIFASGAT